jgi:hypothetical protein
MGVQFSSALPTEAIVIIRKKGLSFPVRGEVRKQLKLSVSKA